jgi:hypothetical protein
MQESLYAVKEMGDGDNVARGRHGVDTKVYPYDDSHSFKICLIASQAA